jgi:hypothetical protein
MRQRNDSGHVVDVAAYPTVEHPELRPFSVGPGESVDFPTALGGFTPADPDAAEPGDTAVLGEAPSRPASARKRAAAAALTPEGVDQP